MHAAWHVHVCMLLLTHDVYTVSCWFAAGQGSTETPVEGSIASSRGHALLLRLTGMPALCCCDGFLQQIPAYTALQGLSHGRCGPPLAVLLIQARVGLRQPPLLSICHVGVIADSTSTGGASSRLCHPPGMQLACCQACLVHELRI
jgi:hypothetical protein